MPKPFIVRAGYRSLSRWQANLHLAATGMARPSLSGSSSRRFLAAAAMRYYIPSGPLKKLASGKVVMSMLGSIMHVLKLGLRLPVMLLTSAIASLAYIEYKLSQMSAPGWVTGSLEKMRGWLEGVRDSGWLRSATSDTQDDDKEAIDKAQGTQIKLGLRQSHARLRPRRSCASDIFLVGFIKNIYNMQCGLSDLSIQRIWLDCKFIDLANIHVKMREIRKIVRITRGISSMLTVVQFGSRLFSNKLC
ncbi:hypothetical protein BX667DRAFT_505531 [Coemansia mojavensis]|nr:hypothetical protein BX667DRAFT_505531 [Coemansia mojavensis]